MLELPRGAMGGGRGGDGKLCSKTLSGKGAIRGEGCAIYVCYTHIDRLNPADTQAHQL